MKAEELFENTRQTLTLYHGTSMSSARQLMQSGWKPNSTRSGSQQGQTRYLYLTTDPEDARWFADEKDNGVVLKVNNVPYGFLKVDPEDGVGYSIEDEINSKHGLPGKLVLFRPLPGNNFSFYR